MKKPSLDKSPLGGIGILIKPSSDDQESKVSGGDEHAKQACKELFEALGVEPKDEDGACEALIALVDLRIAHSEDEEGEEEGDEGEEEEK